MAEKTLDRRTKMTKAILQDALIENMRTKPLHEISVKKICEDADVNRSTFYRYYDSPFQLHDEILENISDEILKRVRFEAIASGNAIKMFGDIFTYIEENRELMLVILGPNGGINLGEKLTHVINKFIDNEKSTQLTQYITQFISAGLIHIVWKWLNEENPLDARSIAVIVNAIISQGVAHAVKITVRAEDMHNELNRKKLYGTDRK